MLEFPARRMRFRGCLRAMPITVSPGATTMPKRSLHGALILFLLIALPVRADVRYVDVDAPVSGSGNAWCDAFTDLQDCAGDRPGR
jgi:hypothetical protein